jgi:hypothetical protein
MIAQFKKAYNTAKARDVDNTTATAIKVRTRFHNSYLSRIKNQEVLTEELENVIALARGLLAVGGSLPVLVESEKLGKIKLTILDKSAKLDIQFTEHSETSIF